MVTVSVGSDEAEMMDYHGRAHTCDEELEAKWTYRI